MIAIDRNGCGAAFAGWQLPGCWGSAMTAISPKAIAGTPQPPLAPHREPTPYAGWNCGSAPQKTVPTRSDGSRAASARAHRLRSVLPAASRADSPSTLERQPVSLPAILSDQSAPQSAPISLARFACCQPAGDQSSAQPSPAPGRLACCSSCCCCPHSSSPVVSSTAGASLCRQVPTITIKHQAPG